MLLQLLLLVLQSGRVGRRVLEFTMSSLLSFAVYVLCLRRIVSRSGLRGLRVVRSNCVQAVGRFEGRQLL